MIKSLPCWMIITIFGKQLPFRGAQGILARISRTWGVIKSIPQRIGEWKKVWDLKEQGTPKDSHVFYVRMFVSWIIDVKTCFAEENWRWQHSPKYTQFTYLLSLYIYILVTNIYCDFCILEKQFSFDVKKTSKVL